MVSGSDNDCENNVGRASHARVRKRTNTHTRDERAPISFFLGTAVSSVEAIKVGASYAPMRLYFAFARSAAHSVIGVIDCYFSYLRSSDATRRWARVSMWSPARIRISMEIAMSRDDFPDRQCTSLACYSRLRVAVDLHARRFISPLRYILIVSLFLSLPLDLLLSFPLFFFLFSSWLTSLSRLTVLRAATRSNVAPSLGKINRAKMRSKSSWSWAAMNWPIRTKRIPVPFVRIFESTLM